MEGQGEGLWGLGSLYHQACPEATADSLGMTSCPERTRSAWLDPGAGSQGREEPLSRPRLGAGTSPCPSPGGPSLIWVVARLPACDPPSQLGRVWAPLGTEGCNSGHGRGGWVIPSKDFWAGVLVSISRRVSMNGTGV